MAKVHLQFLLSSGSCYITSKQETFTIWMRSLVLNGRGCTVFDSNGSIVYRVDNYNCKQNDEVHLMDFTGKVLFTILRKKFRLFRFWEGYRSTGKTEVEPHRPGFQVRKNFKILRGDSPCEVIAGLDENQLCPYKIRSGKSTCKVVDKFGRVIAEVKRKQSTCGVDFGEDVLTMMVEPHIDHSLIMGLVVVYSIINCKM